MVHLHYLVEEDNIITSSRNGVHYNDDEDHVYYDVMPPSLVFEPQCFSVHLQTQLPSLALIARKRQGEAEMLQYLLLVASLYVLF